MADDGSTEAGADSQVTFKVKTSSERTHTITMSESMTVLDLKTKMAGQDYEDIAVDRQRLIYSGRVMKNDDTLASYKIKPNNTIHMVKSSASSRSQPAAASTWTPPAVPTNMAAGTANNPLAGLTGARYAGHQINLPGMDVFGPDGGMGPPMDGERLQQMMTDPNVQQAMREALNNPDFVNMMIDSNPMLRNMPGAREILSSPEVQRMMSNPDMLRNAMQMQSMMGGVGDTGAFPAPGATDTTPGDAPSGNGSATGAAGNAQANAALNPFMMPGMMGQGTSGGMDLAAIRQAAEVMNRRMGTSALGRDAAAGQGDDGSAQPANPFAALLAASSSPAGAEGNFEHLLRFLEARPGASASPPDNRPPEERYADQLRQLNDMGFFDFDRNIAALRRSGGSVQGAIEHLLNASD
ncbi:hypothetical protein CDD81_68 [Ophiocordyceps australis]|uniref:Ubiquitin-like domain-containing protein n=1 Tax=Ophiocordyceps australis TaxID=1399860 RepID=A0A2C5YK58_9HYPO|nr:hypothetical protein CDD81_68 [Ophiocordyceps australis]